MTGLEYAVTTKNAKGTKSPGIFTYKLRGLRKRVLLCLKVLAVCANFRRPHHGGTEGTEGEFEIKKSLRTPRLCGESRFSRFWLRLCRARCFVVIVALFLVSAAFMRFNVRIIR